MGKYSIIITGATASGKSGIALDFAKSIKRAVIINCDSVQLYRDLSILTARPNINERTGELDGIRHELYGVLASNNRGSVADFLMMIEPLIKRYLRDDILPIIVGGTGMYIKSLISGMASIPEIDETVRAKVNLIGEEDLHSNLELIDKVSAEKISPSDKQRLRRAIEVMESTGKPIWQWQNENSKPPLEGVEYILHQVEMSRDDIYDNINHRFSNMIANGAIEEVENLLSLNLSKDLPIMKACGVKEISSYLAGEISIEDAKEKAIQITRNYAKRQLTWFRHQFLNIELIQNSGEIKKYR